MGVSDRYIMPFGKYEGRPIGDVPAQYLDWMAGQKWKNQHPTVMQYIRENRVHLDYELGNGNVNWR